MHRLALPIPGPRSVHFPQALNADFYEQLTAERQVTKYTKGVARLEWIKTAGRRNEALDCAAYAYAAAHRAGLARFTAGSWRTLTAAPTPAGPAGTTPPAPTGRGVRGRFTSEFSPQAGDRWRW